MNSTNNNNNNNNNHHANGNIASKYNLPKFNSTANSQAATTTTTTTTTNAATNRIPSNHILDSTFLHPNDSIAYNTTRTISSSSTSMISTPSNNIRRFQKHRPPQNNQDSKSQQQSQSQSQPPSKTSKNAASIKSKLLNLQQSSKRFIDGDFTHHNRNHHHNQHPHHNSNNNNAIVSQTDIDESHPNRSVPSFIIHKPINMNGYDYSVYTNYPNGIDLQHGDHLPPAVKESQIKAWESAERISKNIIFGDSSESEDNDDDEENEEVEEKHDIYNDKTNNKTNENSNKLKSNIIQAIPGYTRGDLQIIINAFKNAKFKDESFDIELKKLLNESKRDIQMHHEKVFSQAHTFNAKRQIQITQKKEVLTRLFGLNNSLNQDYITNNSIYSSFDNSSNIQKTFLEDRDEISSLLEEDRAFLGELSEVQSVLNEKKTMGIEISQLMNKDGSNPTTTTNVRKRRRTRRSSSTSSISSDEEFDINKFEYGKFQTTINKRLDTLYNSRLKNVHHHHPSQVLEDDEEEDTNDVDDDDDNIYDDTIDESNDDFHLYTINFLRRCLKLTTDNTNTMGSDE